MELPVCWSTQPAGVLLLGRCCPAVPGNARVEFMVLLILIVRAHVARDRPSRDGQVEESSFAAGARLLWGA